MNFTTKKLKRHQFLLQEGETIPNDYLITEGLVKAYHIDKNDKEYILQFALEDWWVTDYQAYFNGLKSSIYIDCIEDTEMLCLSFIK